MPETRVPESARTRRFRWFFNLFPAYRRTGGRVTFIAADWSEVRIRLPLNWATRNYVGTIFGGSLYGAVDPVYMIMLLKRLGPAFVVWDKAAAIRFKRPGRGLLRATFRIPDGELDAIRAALDAEHSVDRVYAVDLVADDGTVCATVEKTIYVRRKEGR
jgi:acyl-coenzyme A thioesterase PaaI-like protein